GVSLLVVFLIAIAFLFWVQNESPPRDQIKYSVFRQELGRDNIKEVTLNDKLRAVGKFRKPPAIEVAEPRTGDEPPKIVRKQLKPDFSVNISPYVGEDFDKELRAKGVIVTAETSTDSASIMMIVYLIGTVLVFVFVWVMFRRARDQFMGGGIL